MIQELYKALLFWIDRNAGRPPQRIRVAPHVMSALEDELDKIPLKHDPAAIGGFKLAGVPVEKDERVLFAEVER